MKWQPITDIPVEWQKLSSEELKAFVPLWHEQKEKLRNDKALKEFNEKLKREWAIETGIIEGLYNLDRGTTQLLIERGLEASLIAHGTTDKPAKKIVDILNDHQDVLDGLFDFVSQKRPLSTSYIKEVHAALTRNQDKTEAIDQFGKRMEIPLLKGEWKKQSNNPKRTDGSIHEYCPPEHAIAEMDQLIKFHLAQEKAKVPSEIQAAWLHHRFTQIHPFQDGNGRVARVLASLIFLRSDWFPLVVTRDDRENYIQSLECADAGDLRPLISLFADIQKGAFLKAISISQSVLSESTREKDVIAAGVERLKAKLEGKKEGQKNVFGLANELVNRAENKLKKTAQELEKAFSVANREYNKNFKAYVDKATLNEHMDRLHWYGSDVVGIAKSLAYFADTRTFRAWVKLNIREDRQTQLVFSFHCVGAQFIGLMGVSGFIKFKDMDEDDTSAHQEPQIIADKIFAFSYNEKEDDVFLRFDEWLKNATLFALEQWRKQT
jgi:Fic family protein